MIRLRATRFHPCDGPSPRVGLTVRLTIRILLSVALLEMFLLTSVTKEENEKKLPARSLACSIHCDTSMPTAPHRVDATKGSVGRIAYNVEVGLVVPDLARQH